MEEKKKVIKLKAMNICKVNIKILGITPLLMDKFPEEVKNQILAKQTGEGTGNKNKIRDIEQEAKEAIHYTNDGQIGYPAHGFKKGMIEGTSFIGDMKFSKKLLSGIKIVNVVDGLIPIKFEKQDVLKHTIGHNTKFTPQFHNWSCELQIIFDANNISQSDLIKLLEYAGFYNGVGAWRPKCAKGGSGEYGQYEVDKGEK